MKKLLFLVAIATICTLNVSAQNAHAKEFFKKSFEECKNSKRVFEKKNFGTIRNNQKYAEISAADTVIFIDNYSDNYNLNLKFSCQKLVLSIFDKKEKHFFSIIYGNKLTKDEEKFFLAFL